MPDAGAGVRPETSSQMLCIENVVKRFGGFTAVDHVSLDVAAGAQLVEDVPADHVHLAQAA